MPRILCAVLMFCLLSGCSSDLSERTASKEIQSRFDEEVRLDFVEIGRIGSHCQWEQDGKIKDLDITPTKELHLIVAEMGGYISITPDGPGYWQVSLTDKGRKAPNAEQITHHNFQSKLNGCDFKAYTLAVAQPKLVRVLNIKRAEDVWNVSYTWKWEPTDFGRSLQKGGGLYSKLTFEQIDLLPYNLAGNGMRLPIPVTTDEMETQAVFKRDMTGKWDWM
jgi:hypothetical protein